MPNKTWQETEKDFESRVKNLGKKAFLYKIPDTKSANYGLLKGQMRVKLKEVPSDYVVTHGAKMFYAEVKHSADEKRFPLSNITKGEMKAMKKQIAAVGLYFFFIYSKFLDQWFVLEGYTILGLMNSRVKSLTWERLENYQWDENFIILPNQGD